MVEQRGPTLLLEGRSSWDSFCPKAAPQLGGKQASSPQPCSARGAQPSNELASLAGVHI